MDIHLDIFGFTVYGYPFGYPWIYMDIHAVTCYGFSIQTVYVGPIWSCPSEKRYPQLPGQHRVERKRLEMQPLKSSAGNVFCRRESFLCCNRTISNTLAISSLQALLSRQCPWTGSHGQEVVVDSTARCTGIVSCQFVCRPAARRSTTTSGSISSPFRTAICATRPRVCATRLALGAGPCLRAFMTTLLTQWRWESSGYFVQDIPYRSYLLVVAALEYFLLTHNSPKSLEWNLAEEKLEESFPLKHEILSFGKCLNW